MPPRKSPPAYRYHKARDCAVVTIAGKNHYLGAYESAESREKYARLLLEWEANGRTQQPVVVDQQSAQLRVKDIILRYYRYAQGEYVDENGDTTDEVTSVRIALRRLRKLYGNTPAVDFGPKALKIVQKAMIDEGLSRKYINDSVNRIRRAFKWCVSEELIPASVHQALQTVEGLRKRRDKTRKTKRVKPVEDDVVAQTLLHCSQVVADMVRLQRLTSARPGEVCILQPGLVDRTDDVWEFSPAQHKTERFDKERVIFIGPQAQAILVPYLLRSDTSYCFSPAESEAQRNRERRDSRKSPLTPSQEARKPKKDRKRPPGDRYTTDSYRCAIHRACDKAFPPPDDLDVEAKKQWQKRHRWSPNRLRHTGSTEIRRKYGVEAATIIMGNSLDVAEIYAERDFEKARQIAKEVG